MVMICEHDGYGFGVEVSSFLANERFPFLILLTFAPRSTYTLAVPGVAGQQIYHHRMYFVPKVRFVTTFFWLRYHDNNLMHREKVAPKFEPQILT